MKMVLQIFVALFCLYLSLRFCIRKLRIPGFSERYVLITGCDSGFGHLLAKTLDKLGLHVFAGCLTDTGIKKLTSSCTDRLVALQLDITNAENIESVLQHVTAALPPDTGLWALINNAGVLGPLGLFDWMSVDDYRKVMEVNLYGHIRMVTSFLPLLRMSKGRVIITTSIMGRLGGTLVPPYIASKFALEGFCDTIRVQLLSSEISVHIIEPGSHKTEMTEDDVMIQNFRETFSRAKDDVKAFYGLDYGDRLIEKVESMKFDASVEGPEPVVDAYVHAVTSRFPKYRYVVGKFTNIFFWPLTHLPEFIGDSFFKSAYPSPTAVLSQQGSTASSLL